MLRSRYLSLAVFLVLASSVSMSLAARKGHGNPVRFRNVWVLPEK